MNPITINTANVIQFGFTAPFDTEAAAIVFDISLLTIFKPGGEANVQGICFEVIDPSGSYLSVIDWTNPAIVPSTGVLTYTVPLSGYPSMFGWYYITGVLREANGIDYTITIPRKNICKPVGFANGVVNATLNEIIDCTAPKVGVSDNTNYTYLNNAPVSQVKTGMFYYPQGTLDPIPFSYTPMVVYGSGNVYTGSYTVRIKIVSSYDMGDQVSVLVSTTGSLTFDVTCNSNLCAVMCCMEKLQDIATTQCNTAQGTDAKNKLEKATIPFIMALTQEKCGVSSSDIVADLMNMLDCDCNCDAQSIEPSPIFTAFTPTVLEGICGTTADYDSPTGRWIIKSRTITLSMTGSISQALGISSTTTDCNVAWNITLDPNVLTGEILNTIADTPVYLALFNSLVAQTGLDLSALGQNCVIDVTNCNYSLTLNVTNPAIIVNNIMINGTTFPSPALPLNNAAGIQTWLNTLALGVFVVNYDSGTLKTTITTAANPNTIGTMTVSLNNVQQVFQFSRSCGSLIAVLKAILDYLCGLTDSQVKIGQSYTICALQANGTVSETTIAADNINTIGTVMTAFAVALCTSLNNILNRSAITCATIKTVFSDKTSVVNTTLDVIYGTRGTTTTVAGQCGALTFEDFALALFSFMTTTNNQTVIDLFCQTKDRCFTAVCNPVQAATIELIQPCPGIAAITGAFTT